MAPHLPKELMEMLGIEDDGHGGHLTLARRREEAHAHDHGHDHDHDHEHEHAHDHHHDHDHDHEHEHEHERDPYGPRRTEKQKPAYSPTLLVVVLCAMALRELGGHRIVSVPATALLVLSTIDLVVRVLRGAGLVRTLHIAVYALFTPQYINFCKLLPRWFLTSYLAQHYHGKVLTHEHAKLLVQGKIDIPRIDVGERILPYKHARSLVLHAGDDIGLLDCPCRRAKGSKACEPRMVCMIFGAFVKPMEKLYKREQFRRVTRDEALVVLEDQHRRGNVHTAFFKDIMDDGFFVLCNCCKCCCGGIEMMNHGSPFMCSSGYVAVVDQAQCIGCGLCARTCAFGAPSIAPREASSTDAVPVKGKVSIIDRDKCLGCGACQVKCPKHCISLVRDEDKPDPLVVNQFQAVDW